MEGHYRASMFRGLIPWKLVMGVAVDSLVVGLMIGLTFVSTEPGAVIMTIALTVQMGFTGFSVGGIFREDEITKCATAGLSLIFFVCILVGGALGALLLSVLTLPWSLALLSFGVAAILYVVAEEMMVEAHADPIEGVDTYLVTVQFFIGFLFVLVLHKFQATSLVEAQGHPAASSGPAAPTVSFLPFDSFPPVVTAFGNAGFDTRMLYSSSYASSSSYYSSSRSLQSMLQTHVRYARTT
eukprot:gb/GEZN01016545.1/.p1 GENE.gb/GEZN01016545.1/~~gb/GEZN01016545.1/.p1  ORF type:complete len:240 (+),score=29.75 gb/GEZN01016545.1/:99-818(+)